MYTQDKLYMQHGSSTPDLSSFTRKFLSLYFSNLLLK